MRKNVNMWNPETTIKTGMRVKNSFQTRTRLIASVFLFAGLCTFTSCGEKKIPDKITATQTEVAGDLKEQYVLVDKEYSLSKYSNTFTVELKRTDVPLPNFNRIGVGIEIYDKKGKVLISQSPQVERISGFDGGIINLLSLETGQYGDISINIADYFEKIHKAATFKIMIQTNTSEVDQTWTDDDSEEEISVTSTSDEDWDAVLKSYENYINQYIKLIKKAMSGDISAMNEYAEMLEKAEDLAEKLEDAEDNLTTAQMNKFIKLQQKLASAAMEI